MLHYGPISYFSLGRVVPRDQLREICPVRRRRPLPPMRTMMTGATLRIVPISGDCDSVHVSGAGDGITEEGGIA